MREPKASGEHEDMPQAQDEYTKSTFKRAKMTIERIQLVANTLTLAGNLREYGIKF